MSQKFVVHDRITLSSKARRRMFRVLLVDNEQADRQLYESLLRPITSRVIPVDSATKMVTYCLDHRHSQPPDVIVANLNLGDMRLDIGLRHLEKHLGLRYPTVLITTDESNATLQRLLLTGLIDNYLTKPLTTGQLQAGIAVAWEMCLCRQEIHQLQLTIKRRFDIEKAKDFLCESKQAKSGREALKAMRHLARSSKRTMAEVAQGILTAKAVKEQSRQKK